MNAELLHAWMIFQHAEISQAGANEKIARPTPDLQLFPAQPDALLNFVLGILLPLYALSDRFELFKEEPEPCTDAVALKGDEGSAPIKA